jgi:hypothetical protein
MTARPPAMVATQRTQGRARPRSAFRPRQAGRDRTRARRHAARALPADAARHLARARTGRRSRPQIGQLYRASLPHRRFRGLQYPVLLDLYFAMQTKRIPVGQLGIACRLRTRSVSPRCRRSNASGPRSRCAPRDHTKWERADSPQACARARRPVALRQSAKPHNVDLSFCYQLPVNHSR